MRVRKYKAKEFVIPQKINRVPNWNNPKLWEISDIIHFPEWYQELVDETRKEVEKYYNNGLVADLDESFQQSSRTLRRLAKHLPNGMNIKEALFKSNGWRGKIGFGIAIYQMRKYFQDNEIYPTSNSNSIFEGIRRAASTNWDEFNIYSWNDRMLFVYNTRNDAKYAIDGGLEIAIEELKQKEKEIGKLLYSKDCPGILQAVVRSVFEDDGINSWNELLFLVFEDIHVEVGKYLGVEGIELAKNELREYYEIHNKLPTINIPETIGISNAISRGNFREFNIHRWNDLLRAVFGEVNIITRKYREKQGLEVAKFELLEFYKQTGNIPSYSDTQFVSIINAANNNRWEQLGITSFNDLLMYVFGKVNRVSPNTYKGFKGLHYIQGVLIEFFEEHSRIPTSADNGMNGINGAISRGYYEDHRINTWNDLLKITFGELNHRQLVYNGKEGLDLARKEMKEHYEKTGELPKSKDFHGIVAALKRKEWVDYGFTYWNDMLDAVFGEVNHRIINLPRKEGNQE